MKKIHVFILSLGLTFGAASALAQADIHFSQFYETSILRNPALTGIFTNDYKVGGYYRNQWSSISSPFVTTLGFAEVRTSISRTSEDYVSFGLLAFTDKAGSIDQKITAFYPALNYSKSLNVDHNTYLSAGFTAGYTQYSFDPSKATFNNQYQFGYFDPTNPTMENINNSKMSMWDLGAGINYNSSTGLNNNVTYMFGVSAYHFTQPKFSYYNNVSGITENMRINVNAASGFDLKSDISMQVHANYALQGAYTEIMAGTLVTWNPSVYANGPDFALTGGVFYRFQDAIVPVVKIKYRTLAIGYSYDVNVSTLKAASKLRGGYEFTASFSGNFKNKSDILKKTVCPKF